MGVVQEARANGQTEVRFTGLPPELEPIVIHFNAQEKWQNFKEVLECSVALHAAITDDSANQH